MATYYWVGGSGNWDATSTTNWATSSGGSGGAGVPTSADDVIFDAGSNVGTGAFTVTVTGTSAAPAVCRDFSTGGAGGALDGAMTLTMGATAVLDVYGSMTLPATNFAFSSTTGAVVNFRATSTGKTLTSNGVSFGNTAITFNGVGGVWTLGSAYTSTNSVTITNGTFDSGNFNITVVSIGSSNSNIRTITLGSSTVTLSGTSPLSFTTSTNLTLNAGTSTIICSAASSTFAGGGLTFYDVTFSSATAGTATINGANTFNNLTFTSVSAGVRGTVFGGSQTVNGTLTFGSGSTAIRRLLVQSSVVGTQRTITLNGTLASLADVDFRDINAAGTVATPWTGTRLGDCKGNANITFDAPKTVYWNLAGSQTWSATGWATTNNGTPAVNNFPLAQDTAVFTEAGAAGTVTINASWQIGSIQMADGVSNRTTAFTLASTTAAPFIYGNVTLFANLTLSGTGVLTFASQGATQTITSAGKTFTQPITINSPSGTVQLLDNTTTTNTITLTAGTLDLSSGNRTLSCGLFVSSNSNTRVIAFGTGNITITGSGTVWNTGTVTNFSYTGTPTVNISNNSATATTVTTGAMTETQALNFNYTTGTYTLTDTSAVYRNANFTGFAGTLGNAARTIFGDLTISTGMTLTAGTNITTFAATSGTQQVTSNGKTLDFPLTVNATGGIVAFQDALTQGSTRNFTLTNGTAQFKNGVTSTVGNFLTSGTNQKFLQSTTPGSQATLSEAAGTVDVSYLTIRDINATGGATWNAFVNQQNIDAGNNDGWDFGISPIVGSYEYTYQLRSFTQPRRF